MMDKIETFNVPQNLCESVAQSYENVKMIVMTQHEVKPEKFENKVILLTDCRLIITSTRIPCKEEQSFNLLSIRCLESKTSSKLNFNADGKQWSFMISDTDRIDSLLIYIIEALAAGFPKVPHQRLIGPVEVEPSTRSFHSRLQDFNMRQEKLDHKPCGGFSASYHFQCDYLGLQYMNDVAWDIDTIYMCNNMKELNLSDFRYLDGKALLPLITALDYNEWFTSLNADGVKLLPEVLNAIGVMMSKNTTIKELHMSDTAIRSDFIQRLTAALNSNTHTELVCLDLSNNPIEDKGAILLAGAIAKLPKGLIHLNLSQTSLMTRGINKLSESLCANSLIATTLEFLDLSYNSLKGDEHTNLFNFLAQPNSLVHLNLMSTDCALDSIFGALMSGCCQRLKHLNLSHNSFFSKKSSKVQPSCSRFLSTAIHLQYVNLSNCRLNGEALKSIISGLGSNMSSKQIELVISNNNLGQEAMTLEMYLLESSSITSLDLSDNNLDISLLSLIPVIAKNKSIKKISIGKNFSNLKSKRLTHVLEFLNEMIVQDDSHLESLSLAGSKLRTAITTFINALGANTSLKEIDISGNQMGDGAAHMLAKALQINTSLHTIHLDQNSITAQGFTDIARALEKNFTLKNIPLPLADITAAMKINPLATEAAVKKIESLLQRNHSSRKFATDQCYKLQQSFLTNLLQQSMDRAIVDIQNTANKLEAMNINSEDVLDHLSETHCLIKDASNSRKILAKYQMIAEKSESPDGVMHQYLKTFADELQNAVDDELKRNIDEMLECSSERCPTLLENTDLRAKVSLKCKEKAQIPKGFIQELVLNQLGADLFNKLGEVNLSVANFMSDLLIESVQSALRENHRRLRKHLEELQNRTASDDNKDKADHEQRPGSILRQKQSQENGDLLDPNFISAAKRKSVYNCKVRPQSTVVHHQIEPLTFSSPVSHPLAGLPSASPAADGMDKKEPSTEAGSETKPDSKPEGSSSPIPKPRRKRLSGMPPGGAGTNKETEAVQPPLPHLHQKSSARREQSFEAECKHAQSTADAVAEDVFTDSTDLTDGSTSSSPLNSRENTPSHEPHSRKMKKSKSSEKELNLDVPLDNIHHLKHIVKDRPKRPKNRPITRLAIHSQAVVIDDNEETKEVQNGVEDFFSGNSKTVPELKSPTSVTEREDSTKSKKKGWSPFSGKSGDKGIPFLQSKKQQGLKSPSTSGSKKGGASPFPEIRDVLGGHSIKDKSEVKEKSNKDRTEVKEKSNKDRTEVKEKSNKDRTEVKDKSNKDRTEVKDKSNSQERSASADNTHNQDGAKSDEDKDLDEVEERKPRKIPGIGFGGELGSSALIAEMKAKRASMVPVAAKKTDTDDHAPGRPLLPPGGGSSPGLHTTSNRPVSPGSALEEKSKLPPCRPRPPPTVPPKPKSGQASSETKPAVTPVKPGGPDGTSGHSKQGRPKEGSTESEVISTDSLNSGSKAEEETSEEVYL